MEPALDNRFGAQLSIGVKKPEEKPAGFNTRRLDSEIGLAKRLARCIQRCLRSIGAGFFS